MPMKGYNGAINGVGGMFYFEIDELASANPAPNSATENLANELEGTTDWWGHYFAHGHTPGTDPNNTLAFSGTTDQDDTTNNNVAGTAMVERWRVNWNFANNSAIFHQVWFHAHGALSKGSATITDATSPEWYMSGDGKCSIGTAVGSPVYSDLDDVIAMSLSYMAEVDQYVSSSTANGTRSLPGNLRWMLDLAVHVDDVVAMEALDSPKAFRGYVDASTYWEAEYVRWKRLGKFAVDIKGRQVVAVQYRGMPAGWIDVAGVWTKGGLTNPAASAVWPVP